MHAVQYVDDTHCFVQMRDRYESARAMDLSPCEKSQLLADKWRHERNFWLSALMVTLWIVLNRFYQMSVQLMNMSDMLEDQNAPATSGSTPETKKTT